MLLDEGGEHIGRRLVRRFIEHWDTGNTFEPLLAVRRSAAVQPLARKLLHDTPAGPMAERSAPSSAWTTTCCASSWSPPT
jgi:hypothetical protein